MIDRNGYEVVVALSAHEILWVEAAMTLPLEAREDAFRDICQMSGRSYSSVHAQAYARAAKRRKEQAVAFEAMRQASVKRAPAPPLPPSTIIPTREQLMAGRSTYSPTTGMR